MSNEAVRARPSKISDEALRAAVPGAANLRQLLLALGVAAYGGNYEVIRGRLHALGIDDPRFGRRPRRSAPRQIAQSEVRRCIPLVLSYAELARMLGLGGSTAAQRRAKRLALDSGMDLSHFLGSASSRGHPSGSRNAEPLEALLVAGRRMRTSALRERLIDEGFLPRCCSGCGLERWHRRPIPLELDHIDGDRSNNRLENLRLLCPNCHAQTDTYRGRNIGGLNGATSDTAVRASRRLANRRDRATRRLEMVLLQCKP